MVPVEASAKEGCFHPPRGFGNSRPSVREVQQVVTYVYLIASESHPDQRYVGVTADLRERLAEHNRGKSPHTSKYVPWRLITYLAFSDETTAYAFERYLKSGSGRAFAQKRLWTCPP